MISAIHQSTVWRKENKFLNTRFKGVPFKSIDYCFLKSKCILTFEWRNNFKECKSWLSFFWISKNNISNLLFHNTFVCWPIIQYSKNLTLVNFFSCFYQKKYWEMQNIKSLQELSFSYAPVYFTPCNFSSLSLTFQISEVMSFEG